MIRVNNNKFPYVCISAGHGGQDNGASNQGINEANIVLQTAWKLRTIFLWHGIDNYLARQSEAIKVSYIDRAKLANQQNVDLYISLHINSATEANANGSETLYGRNNSKEIATLIQKCIVEDFGTYDRGVKLRTDLQECMLPTAPSVIVEPVFISNANEFKIVSKDTFYIEYAEAVARGICNWFGIKYIYRNDR